MENITVVIVTYQTPIKIILDCLKSIDKNVKVSAINSEEDILIGIFDLIGRKMHNELNELPFGVYIMKYEGKSIKIIKH